MNSEQFVLNDFTEEFLGNCLTGLFALWPHSGLRACLQLPGLLLGSPVVRKSRVRVEGVTPTLFTYRPWLGHPDIPSNPSRAPEESMQIACFPHPWWKSSALWTPCEQRDASVHVVATLFIQGLQCLHQAEPSRARLGHFRMCLKPLLLPCSCSAWVTLLRHRLWFSGWAGAWDAACLTCSQVMLIWGCVGTGPLTWPLFMRCLSSCWGSDHRSAPCVSTKIQIPEDVRPWAMHPDASWCSRGEAGFSGLWWAFWAPPSVARTEVVAAGEPGRFTALGWHQGRGLDSQPLGIGGQNLSPRFQRALQDENSWLKGRCQSPERGSKEKADVTKFSPLPPGCKGFQQIVELSLQYHRWVKCPCLLAHFPGVPEMLMCSQPLATQQPGDFF